MTYARWKSDGYNPALLVDRLEGLRRQSATGNVVTYEGDPFFDDVVTVLESAVEFVEPMTERDRRQIVFGALFSPRKGRLNTGALLGDINTRARDFALKPESRYVLATSLSTRHFGGLKNTRISGHHVTFGRTLPRAFRGRYEEAKARSRDYVFGEYPDPGSTTKHYSAVRVSTRGRSEFEASSRALDALDLLRGIWNLYLNGRKWTRTTAQRRKPVNPVILGPLHSLHRPSGALATDLDWYEYDYVEPIQTRELKRRWPQVRRFEDKVRRLLSRSARRAALESYIRRYTRALDTREWDAAFVQLWGLLEDLTGTKEGQSHKDTVRRAAFLYAETERQLHVQVLNHLRYYRNTSVHGGVASEDVEAYLYQLKRYVEQLLMFHLENPFGFSSIEETAQFLHLPAEPGTLRLRIEELKADAKLAELGYRFRTGP